MGCRRANFKNYFSWRPGFEPWSPVLRARQELLRDSLAFGKHSFRWDCGSQMDSSLIHCLPPPPLSSSPPPPPNSSLAASSLTKTVSAYINTFSAPFAPSSSSLFLSFGLHYAARRGILQEFKAEVAKIAGHCDMCQEKQREKAARKREEEIATAGKFTDSSFCLSTPFWS